jgi:hypothetical protein
MKFKGEPLTLTHVEVEVRSLGGKDAFKAAFLVSIELVDSKDPASELRKIGMKVQGKRPCELANGELRECEYGFAEMRFLNEIGTTRIVFGPDDCEPSLGFIAFGSAGFYVDLKAKTVRKLLARPLYRH